MSELSIQDLTKTFKTKVAVNHLDMQIPSGKFIAFLGPNAPVSQPQLGC
nr:hypothetical protein [Secundilactobacillus paracollinoides]